LKKSTASKRQKWGQGVQNTQYKENTGGKIWWQMPISTQLHQHDSNWECQDDSTNEMTCSYIHRSLQKLSTINEDLDEIRKIRIKISLYNKTLT
jgi:hypothetical protein